MGLKEMITLLLSIIIFGLFVIAALYKGYLACSLLILIGIILGCSCHKYLKEIRVLNPKTIYGTLLIISGLSLFLFFSSNIIGYFSSFALIILFSDLIFSRRLLTINKLPDNLLAKINIGIVILIIGIILTGIIGLITSLSYWILICMTIFLDTLVIRILSQIKNLA